MKHADYVHHKVKSFVKISKSLKISKNQPNSAKLSLISENVLELITLVTKHFSNLENSWDLLRLLETIYPIKERGDNSASALNQTHPSHKFLLFIQLFILPATTCVIQPRVACFKFWIPFIWSFFCFWFFALFGGAYERRFFDFWQVRFG